MRIAFTGPESSGKTTFSKWLSNQLKDSLYVSEYAREYLEERQIARASELDFKEIAHNQCARFNLSSKNGHDIFDTDIFVLRVWNEEVFKLKLPELEMLPSYAMDIHFLCFPDVEWEEDPLRSASDQGERERLYHLFRLELTSNNIFFVELKGTQKEKENSILSSIETFLSKD